MPSPSRIDSEAPIEPDRETESPPDIPDLIGKIVGGDLTSKGEKKSGRKAA